MFEYMVSSLRHNEIVDKNILALRLQIALTKKEGVLNIPYLMRSSDPKINPSLKHLLWAAILLQDEVSLEKVLGFMFWEQCDQNAQPIKAEYVNTLTAEYLAEFFSLPSEQTFCDILKHISAQISALDQYA